MCKVLWDCVLFKKWFMGLSYCVHWCMGNCSDRTTIAKFYSVIEQTSPHKVCTQIGLCVSDGAHSIRLAQFINYSKSCRSIYEFYFPWHVLLNYHAATELNLLLRDKIVVLIFSVMLVRWLLSGYRFNSEKTRQKSSFWIMLIRLGYFVLFGQFFMIWNCTECASISYSNVHCSSMIVSLASMVNQLLIAIRSQRCQILHST